MINRTVSLWTYPSLWTYIVLAFKRRQVLKLFWTIKKYMVQFNLSLAEAVGYHFDIGEGRTMPCIYLDSYYCDDYASSVDLHMRTWSPDDSCVVCNRELSLGPDEWDEEMFGSPA